MYIIITLLYYLYIGIDKLCLKMNTLKSLVILSLVLAVATGEREKRGLSNWCRAFGCPPDSAFKVCAKTKRFNRGN